MSAADPWEGFVHFMRGTCRLQAEDRGLKEAMLSRGRGTSRIASARDRVAPVAGEIFQRAKEAGAIRADLDNFDIPLMNMAVGHVADRTRDVDPEYWQRLLVILLDGIVARRDASTTLPSGPLGPEDFARAMEAKRC